MYAEAEPGRLDLTADGDRHRAGPSTGTTQWSTAQARTRIRCLDAIGASVATAPSHEGHRPDRHPPEPVGRGAASCVEPPTGRSWAELVPQFQSSLAENDVGLPHASFPVPIG